MLDDSLRATHIIKHSKLKYTVTFNKYYYMSKSWRSHSSTNSFIWYNIYMQA